MAALDTTTYTSGPLNHGRSGYNRDGTDDTTRDQNRGCNRSGEEENDPNSGRSGYN